MVVSKSLQKSRFVSCNTLRALNYGICGIFLIMGNAGHISGFEGCVAAESSLVGYEWFYAGASMKHVVKFFAGRMGS